MGPTVTSEVLSQLKRLHDSIVQVIRGKSDIVDFLIAALLARGHVLLEDVPGVGKTTLAHVISNVTKSHFERINATTSNVAEIREILGRAKDRRRIDG